MKENTTEKESTPLIKVKLLEESCSGGFKPGELLIITGRRGIGKSNFLLRMIEMKYRLNNKTDENDKR